MLWDSEFSALFYRFFLPVSIFTPKGTYSQHSVPLRCRTVTGKVSNNLLLILPLISHFNPLAHMTEDSKDPYQGEIILHIAMPDLRGLFSAHAKVLRSFMDMIADWSIFFSCTEHSISLICGAYLELWRRENQPQICIKSDLRNFQPWHGLEVAPYFFIHARASVTQKRSVWSRIPRSQRLK